MATRVLLGTALAGALFVFGAAFVLRPAAPVPAAQTVEMNTSPVGTTTQPPQPGGYTLADIAAHANAQSCWAAINGNVYDLTQWVGQHPGGPEAILYICGTDASAAFNAQHGRQPEPAQELARFYIGTLAQ